MGQEAKRLREAPLRQRVRREALVKDADRRLEPLVPQVRVKVGQRGRHDHAFVADRDRRQTRNVGIAFAETLFGTAPRQEQPAIEAASRHAVRCVDEYLLDVGQRLQRLVAAYRGIDRHDTPARDLEADLADCGGYHLARIVDSGFVLAQEHRARRKAFIKTESELLADRAHERLREFDQQAAAIAGLAVSGNCAAMGQAGERGDRRFDDPVTRHIVEVGDEAEAAAVLLVCRVIETFHVSLGHRRPGVRALRAPRSISRCDSVCHAGFGLQRGNHRSRPSQ